MIKRTTSGVLSTLFFSASVFILAQPHDVSGQAGQAEAAPAPPSATGPAQEAFSMAELMETYGYIIATQTGMLDMELGEDEFESLIEGMKHAYEHGEPTVEIERIGPQLQAFLQRKQMEVSARRSAEAQAEAAIFFEELAQRDDVIQLESGLFYEVVEAGEGETPTIDDTVRIHYEGSLVNGEVFDSSYARGEPIEFPLTGIIPGMAEGLQQISEGAEAILYIPSDLAYGDQGQQGIPPGATLIFKVELLEVISPEN
ncbi:MAG: FKBP-type peptidyl-prolyl cis-trans isomerase [Opitutales bacterium]